MDNRQGTPKNIQEAVALAICTASGPSAAKTVEDTFVDYLSQKFTVMAFEAPEQEPLIKELWTRVTGRPWGGPQ